LLDAILRNVNYRAYLEDGTEEGEERWANVMELRGVAGVDGQMGLSEFLQQVALVAETDNLDNGGPGHHAVDAPRRQGAGVPGRVHHRAGRGPAAP
jgi:hypothetical protein